MRLFWLSLRNKVSGSMLLLASSCYLCWQSSHMSYSMITHDLLYRGNGLWSPMANGTYPWPYVTQAFSNVTVATSSWRQWNVRRDGFNITTSNPWFSSNLASGNPLARLKGHTKRRCDSTRLLHKNNTPINQLINLHEYSCISVVSLDIKK